MIEWIKYIGKMIIMLLPFLLFALLNAKANLKKELRSRQMLMPIAALVYGLAAMVLMGQVSTWILELLNRIPGWLYQFAAWLSSVWDGKLAGLAGIFRQLAIWLWRIVDVLDIHFWICFLANAAILLAFVILKKILLMIFKRVFKKENALYDKLAGFFYQQADDGSWYVKPHCGQGRSLLKTIYYATLATTCLLMLASGVLYKLRLIMVPFYPVFGVIIVGELYFFLDGLTRQEALGDEISGEDEEASSISNYSLLRKVLRKLFGDKLHAEDTGATSETGDGQSNEELLDELENCGQDMLEIYGRFMRGYLEQKGQLDRNYLLSGKDLLLGKSILFNNPFYYDLIPYAFYPMNRTLLRHKKILVILGRHGTQEDIAQWCEEGLRTVTHVPQMWNIGELTQEPQDLDVGIITRSSVHDLKLHEANEEFFSQVEFVLLIEPSRLVTTAQIGLNSLVRHCRGENKKITFCSTDKNCDGLVDALSHILMSSISEVAATNRHEGVCSYMCWEADQEHLQHRMLPNLSRYLGMGTELSFVALKNQVAKTSWYGGERFPVTDMHWIVKQYYYDLLHYAGLPLTQKSIDDHFLVSHNLWNARVEKSQFLTVEDEACNMFEVKRNFSTRASQQSFINIISPEYLLKDYMAENDGIFNADPKAIPYIVADYARTARNVVLRLCLRLSTGVVSQEEVARELMLVEARGATLKQTLWELLCAVTEPIGVVEKNAEGEKVLRREFQGKTYEFGPDTICSKRKFSMKTGKMEDLYYISDLHFKDALLWDLQNAGYIAEDENGDRQYLGTELRGQIFQKYLPGQFFTLGGKYYEMLTVTLDGRVLLRRAADHINGRPTYRQVREYVITNGVDSTAMGDIRDIGGLKLTHQYADIRVSTPAYYQMDRYNDFATGRKVTINGIPDRTYNNKQILRIDLPQEADLTVCRTITLLMNEVFRTIFAENQDFIVAVMAEPAQLPTTYSLRGEGSFTPGSRSIYLIEDSQLDLGLLVAAERNLSRIFSILWDYLDWHQEQMDKSMGVPEAPQAPAAPVEEPEEAPKEEKPKGFFGRLWQKIKNFFKAIGRFFKKLFGKLFGRKKPQEPVEGEVGAPESQEGAAEPKKKLGFFGKIAEFFKKLFGKKKPPETETPEADEPQTLEPEDASVQAPEGEAQAVPEAEVPPQPQDVPAEEAPAVPEAEAVAEPEAVPEAPEAPEVPAPEAAGDEWDQDIWGDEPEETEFESKPPLFSKAAPARVLREEVPDLPDDGSVPNDANDTLEFEPEQVQTVGEGIKLERKPYHQRYYLLYGGQQVPQQLDLAATRAFLEGCGFAGGPMKQARVGKDVAETLERTYVPNKPGSHYCDFCGVELMGTEYEVLSDGRERCMTCGRSSVKTAQEFDKLYRSIARNMEAFYGARIQAPVKVKMVNSKQLHKRLGHTFVPTGKYDGRILGVAIKDREGYSILVENGAPRMSSIMTIAHELTHIWQYLHWNGKAITKKYGPEQELEVYEGMAKWAEIQYAYLLGEPAAAKREEISARMREDEYGRGFRAYVAKYPLSTGTHLEYATPFDKPDEPL